MSDKCPVCQTDVPAPSSSLPVLIEGQLEKYKFTDYRCKRCGDFRVKELTNDIQCGTSPFDAVKDDPRKVAVLSHWIRTRNESIARETVDAKGERKPIILDWKLVEFIAKNPHLSPMKQADNLVRWVGDNSRHGETITVHKCRIEAIVGSIDFAEFCLIFDYLLTERGFITGERRFGDTGADRPRDILVGLSFSGWERHEELKHATSESRQAFMAMAYANRQLADVFENVFRDAVSKTGFDLFRLVDTPQPAGLIDDDVRVKIRASRFLIADLTDGNAGAYWEAGYAEGLGKPVIYTCRKEAFEDAKSSPHFDTNHHLTILWEWDPDRRKEAGEKLKSTIRATLPAEAKLTDD